jgi:hypothetical protein
MVRSSRAVRPSLITIISCNRVTPSGARNAKDASSLYPWRRITSHYEVMRRGERNDFAFPALPNHQLFS